MDYLDSTSAKMQSASKRRYSVASSGILEASLKACKQEEDSLVDSGETTFPLFASLLDSALQGLYLYFLFLYYIHFF